MPAAPFATWSLTAMALALAGAGAAWTSHGGAMFSPGPLHGRDSTATRLGGVSSHAELARRCSSCHPPPWSGATVDARCLACHSDVRAQRADSSSLHARIADAGTCTSCHTEHRGRRGELTLLEGSGLAHEALGFSLSAHRATAKKTRFACADCHDRERWEFQRARCESCHREYQPDFVTKHEKDWGTDCLACHDGEDRFSRGVFQHDRLRFPLPGAHARAACTACHANVRALAGFREAPTVCIDCHRDRDEHRGSFGADCAACHGTDSWKGATFAHEFPIDHGNEGRVACGTCHQDRANWKSYTCYGCHAHTPARIQAKHAEEGIDRDLDNCVRCHPTGGEHEGSGDERRGRERRRGGESREREDH